MAVWCTTLPAAMHHLCGSSAPFRRWRCTIIRGQVALLGRHMHLTLGEIREIARQHLPDNPIYVLLESPHQGDLFCTGLIPDEFRWRRWGITAGFEA